MADAYDFWAERLPGETLAAVDRFWAQFDMLAPSLEAVLDASSEPGTHESLGEAMTEALGTDTEALYWELAPGHAAQDSSTAYHLSITPELYASKRPLARAFIARAPERSGWSFSDARPPVPDGADLLGFVASRAFQDLTLTGAAAARGAHRTIDILGAGDGEGVAGQAGLLFSLLVGEAVERDWLGRVDAAPALPFASGARAGADGAREPAADWVHRFAGEVGALLESLHRARSPGPFAPPRENDEPTLFRLEPQDAPWPRADGLTYLTTRPDYAEARFSGGAIAAVRFTTLPESFLGLRLCRTEDAPFDTLEPRIALADALDAALRSAGLGGVFGEGHGEEHIYVDFTATDIPVAIATTERVLDRLGHRAPADILFDEAGLTDLVWPLATARHSH